MPSVSASIDLPASPEKAFELLSDFNRYEDWLTIHKGWRGALPSTIEPGASITEIVSLLGMDNKIDWTIDEFEQPSRLKISGTGMAGVKVSFTLGVAPTDTGSTANIEAEFNGQMIVGAIGTAVTKSTQKELDTSLDKLAALLG